MESQGCLFGPGLACKVVGGGPWHLRRHNQSPTGALVAASRRPAGILPGPDAAVSPLDIPEGWDPRTNQQPTGLLIALPAAVPCCSNPSGSGCGSIPVRHSWRLGPAHESTAHRAVDCPACGSAVLFESLRVLNKKKTPCQQTRSFAFYGPGGIRTLDLSDANRTLSQLSYRPILRGVTRLGDQPTYSPFECPQLCGAQKRYACTPS